MSARCAAASSKLDEHVRKPTRGRSHVRLSQLWESDLMSRQKPSGISWATNHQCQVETLRLQNDFLGVLVFWGLNKKRSVQKIRVGFTVFTCVICYTMISHNWISFEHLSQCTAITSWFHLQFIYIMNDCQCFANMTLSHFILLNTEWESIERMRLTLISPCTVLWKALQGLVGWC